MVLQLTLIEEETGIHLRRGDGVTIAREMTHKKERIDIMQRDVVTNNWNDISVQKDYYVF